MRQRVLIIGLDGFTWRTGKYLIDENIMPHLGQLTRRGSHGELMSVLPFETCPAWTSFQTGCRPGKTGVFAFHTYDRRSGAMRINSAAECHVPTLWEIADAAGKTAISINMPVSHPAPKIERGAIVPGLLCFELSSNTVHPPEVFEKFVAPVKGYRIVNMDEAQTLEDFVDWQIEVESRRGILARNMMQAYDWDLCCVQMQSTDHFQHGHWWTMDRQAHGFEEQAHQDVLRFYRAVDDSIGMILEGIDDQTTVFVVSDHGFCPIRCYFCINTWLTRHGFLTVIPQEPEDAPHSASVKGMVKLKDKLKETLWPVKKAAQAYGAVKDAIWQAIPKKTEPLFCEKDLGHLRTKIDYEASQAFSLGAMAGMIYLIGPESQRQELAGEISGRLMAEYGPDSENDIIKSVRPGGEHYGDDPDITARPDLVVELAPGVVTVLDPYRPNDLVEKYFTCAYYREKQHGTHEPEGALVMAGPGVKQGGQIDGELIDIMPTALALLGVAVPDHLDGKVLTDAFDVAPQWQTQSMSLGRKSSHAHSDQEQAQVEKHLSDLGYL